MSLKREWDSSCPRVWITWETKGRSWTVEDLAPEDDEKALQMLAETLVVDEPLFHQVEIDKDKEAFGYLYEGWEYQIAERTTLACYTVVDGLKTLVGLNCCGIGHKGVIEESKIPGRRWENLSKAIAHVKSKVNEYEILGVDTVLTGLGLIVRPEYRGARIGKQILEAREHLCKALGVKATVTLFTSGASQRLAEMCGYKTLAEATWKDFADAGLDFPINDNTVKLMAKKFE